MKKIDSLYPKTQICRQKIDPFFQNRGHTKFTEKDPFSAKIRTRYFVRGISGIASGIVSGIISGSIRPEGLPSGIILEVGSTL